MFLMWNLRWNWFENICMQSEHLKVLLWIFMWLFNTECDLKPFWQIWHFQFRSSVWTSLTSMIKLRRVNYFWHVLQFNFDSGLTMWLRSLNLELKTFPFSYSDEFLFTYLTTNDRCFHFIWMQTFCLFLLLFFNPTFFVNCDISQENSSTSVVGKNENEEDFGTNLSKIKPIIRECLRYKQGS